MAIGSPTVRFTQEVLQEPVVRARVYGKSVCVVTKIVGLTDDERRRTSVFTSDSNFWAPRTAETVAMLVKVARGNRSGNRDG